jgi:hypothetical protein
VEFVAIVILNAVMYTAFYWFGYAIGRQAADQDQEFKRIERRMTEQYRGEPFKNRAERVSK